MKNFKKVISAVVALALSASTFVSASSFTDVADTASYAEAIDVLSALGIVNGYAEEDGTFTFKPEGTITRAEAATMIVGALNMTADAQASAGTSKFADVNSQASWATGYVNVGVAQGFISGMDDTTFAPQENVTYAQMCVMLTSIAGYGEYAAKNGGYPTGYTSMAASTGINKGVAVSNDTALTRGQVAQMIWNALQAPMLGVYEYSFQGNTYTQLDGKSGRDFKTLLSDKFDGYVVTANVIGTAKDSTLGLDNDEAKINVTKADWWDDEQVPNGTNAAGSTYYDETVILNGISLDDQLFQIGKAVLVINEDDDVELVYFAATTKTETKEFAAEDYVPQTKLASANKFSGQNKIRFGSKYYTMNTAVPTGATSPIALYVNGVEYTAGSVDDEVLDTFLGNAQGNIKLVKQDSDTGYSKIFVNYYTVAEVTSVDYKNNQTQIIMTTKPLTVHSDYAPGTVALPNVTKLTINDDAVEDGDVVISVKNGDAEIELKDLQEEDIIAYAIDVNTTARQLVDPEHIEVLVSRDTVSGKVAGENNDDETYTIDGKPYKCVDFATVGLTVGDTFTMTLDPFGRIYDCEQDASSTKYAIVEKWNSSSDTVTLVLADGTSKPYELSNNVTEANVLAILYVGGSSANGKNPPENRVVEYTVKTSDNTLRSLTPVTGLPLTGVEYKPSTSKLGSATINASTNIINAEEYAGNSSDYETFSIENFTEKTDYDAYGFKNSGSTYSFILLTRVGTAFTESSRFAVVKDVVGKTTYEDEEAYEVEVFANGEETSLYFYDAPTTLATGDAIFFELDSDGFVKMIDDDNNAGTPNVPAIYEVYSHGAASPFTPFTNIAAMAGKYQTGTWDATNGTSDGWRFTLYDDGSDVALVYGVVAEVNGTNVTLAPVPAAGADIDINADVVSGDTTGGNTYALDSNAEVYVYDTGDTNSIKEEDKIYAGSVIGSAFSMFETAKNSKVYASTANGENRDDYTNYALAMIVDGDIVEIYTINK